MDTINRNNNGAFGQTISNIRAVSAGNVKKVTLKFKHWSDRLMVVSGSLLFSVSCHINLNVCWFFDCWSDKTRHIKMVIDISYCINGFNTVTDWENNLNPSIMKTNRNQSGIPLVHSWELFVVFLQLVTDCFCVAAVKNTTVINKPLVPKLESENL